MEGFKSERSASELETNPESNVYAKVNKELRDIIATSTDISKESRRVLFDRMLHGPEMLSANPELAPYFDQIAKVEETYGTEKVAEMAAFYVGPESLG